MIRTAAILALSAGAAFGDPAVDQARVACTPDALRLCAAVITMPPDIPRIRACLHANAAKLSSACHAAINPAKK